MDCGIVLTDKVTKKKARRTLLVTTRPARE